MSKTVFILGAGASRELHFHSSTLEAITGIITRKEFQCSGPLSRGFFYDTDKFLKEIKEAAFLTPTLNLGNEWLVKYIEDFYNNKTGNRISFNDLLTDEAKSRCLNIEELYSQLESIYETSESIETISTEEIQKLLAIRELLDYIVKIFLVTSYYCYSKLHSILAKHIISTDSQVISFNWDTLIDDALYFARDWDYYDGYGFEPRGILDKSRKLDAKYHYKQRKEPSRSLVIKPHGSVNWYKRIVTGKEDEEGIYLGIPLTREGFFRGGTTFYQGQLQTFETDQKKRYFRTYIIPPGIKRFSFDFLWHKMREILENAEQIIAIGFSFNNYETHLKNFLNTVRLKDSLEIKIVSPENGIVQKYRQIFKCKSINLTHCYFSEYIENNFL